MVEVPPEVQIQALLCPGRTYLFKAEEHSGENKHFHVILNTNPQTDDQIVMVTATTLSSKHMNAYWENLLSLGVLVQVATGDAEFIKHPTLFRCDEPIVRSKATIISKLADGALLQKGIVPDQMLTSLRAGLLNSKRVDEWIKILIR